MLQNNGHIHEPKGWNKLGFDQHAQGKPQLSPAGTPGAVLLWPPRAPADDMVMSDQAVCQPRETPG